MSQPDLPALSGGEPWSARVIDWWRMWGESPQSSGFTASDWDELADIAFIKHAVWEYRDVSLLGELRQRVAKFGATPEDRARLAASGGMPAVSAPSATKPKSAVDEFTQRRKRRRGA